MHHRTTRRDMLRMGVGVGVALSAPTILRAAPPKLSYISFGARNSLWSEPFTLLADALDKATNGEVLIEFTGGPEVVGAVQAVEAVGNGVFDVVHTAPSYYAATMPSAIALSSGTAEGYDFLMEGDNYAYIDGLHREKLGVSMLGMGTSGSKFGIFSKGEPTDLSYYKGKKMRSLPIHDALFRNLEAVPVTLAPSEVYTSLERGLVDGFAWPLIALFENGYHEHAKFLLGAYYFEARTPTMINAAKFDGLGAEVQTALRQASAEADAAMRVRVQEKSAEELGAMEAQGLKIVPLPDDVTTDFVAMAEGTLWDKIIADAPEEGAEFKRIFEQAVNK